MTIKYIKETYPSVYEKANRSSLSWIVRNRKDLLRIFRQRFPKSPFGYVAQFPTNRGSLLLTDEGEVKAVNNVSFLNISTLRKMGMPIV